MFDKIKRAISGWGQDSASEHRPPSPLLSKKDPSYKRNHAFRNSLPARFRHSLYRDESSSSSEVLPLPPPKDVANPFRLQANNKASTPTTNPSSDPDPDSLINTQGVIIPSSPRTPFIRRTSSFQSQRESLECGRDEVPDEDIIMFTSTPPVSIAPSTSVRVPRVTNLTGSIHKGSPDHPVAIPSALNSLNQESSVVQWPRGGTSAANRSQEHFLRTHRRTSTGSDASLKDQQTTISTTPPVIPPLRQYSRTSVSGGSVATTESQQTQTISSTDHTRISTDSSIENIPTAGSQASPASSSIAARPDGYVIPSENNQKLVIHEPDSTKVISCDSLPQVSPIAAKQLAAGTPMLKVSAKKQHSRLFKLDLEQGRILWDSKKFGRINVEQIRELRKGKAARMYREQLGVQPELEERWLTIIYSAMGKYKALHLVASTKDTYEDWIMAVERMWSVKREVAEGLPQLQRKTNQWLKERWLDADKNVDSKLGYEEIVRLCYRLNINFSRKEIRARFDQADEKKQGNLDFNDFTCFVKLLKERKEIVNLFQKNTKGDSMTPNEFQDFLVNVQKSKLDEEQIQEIYGKHIDKTLEKFTVDSLTSFLLSVDNSIISPKHTYVHQDMTQTLSSYYISSSHNTYLLGHQLTGISSIEGYIRALQSGCRCVELDCWDGPDGQPIVYHGHTLTTKILFRDVIEAISTYAFVNSPYPLILSLEVHCDIIQQEIMANIMRVKFGSWLVVAPLTEDISQLPSPDALKQRILIKSKVLPPDSSQSQDFVTDSESDTESDSEGAKRPYLKKKQPKKVRIAKALSDITIYCQSRHFPGFTHDACSPFKVVSLSERVSLRYAKQSLQEYINMNKTHLTRIYPAGFRINSANYDPHHHWAAGNQIVALNYQSYDRGMQINTAMFNMNGHCGYVLKPQPLRLGSGESCNHDKAPSFIKSHPVDVTLEIISAQQLPRPYDAESGDIVDPVCEIELFIPGQSPVKQKTRHINDNGFNPVWEEELKFRVDYEHHELVFFRFIVQDEDIKYSDQIATYCISLDCMEEGYRHIQLHDPSGNPYLYSTLFIKVSIKPLRSIRSRDATLPPLPRDAEAQNASDESRSSTESSQGLDRYFHTRTKSNLEVACDRPLPQIPLTSSPPPSQH